MERGVRKLMVGGRRTGSFEWGRYLLEVEGGQGLVRGRRGTGSYWSVRKLVGESTGR